MLRDERFEIDPSEDAELGVARGGRLEFWVSHEEEVRGILLLVGGQGANEDLCALHALRKWAASRFKIAAVSVFYHGFDCRFSEDEAHHPRLDADSVENLRKGLARIGIKADELNEKNYLAFLDFYNQALDYMGLGSKKELEFTLIPPNGDYQNHGILAALDCLNALKAVRKKFAQAGGGGGRLPSIFYGSFYGGYLALLCAKIAPQAVDCVIETAGEALPVLERILAKDLERHEFVLEYEKVRLNCHTYGLWSRREGAKHYFSDDAYLVRAILNAEHLKIQHAANPHTIFVSLGAREDGGFKDKQTLHLAMQELGFRARLEAYAGKGDAEILERELPPMLEALSSFFSISPAAQNPAQNPDGQNSTATNPADGSAEICYPCRDKIYRFRDTEAGLVCEIFSK